MKKFIPKKEAKKRFFFKGDKIKYNGKDHIVIEGYEGVDPIHPYPIRIESYCGWTQFMSNDEKIGAI